MLLSDDGTHDYIETVKLFDSGHLRVEFSQVGSNQHYTIAIMLYNSVGKKLSTQLANISKRRSCSILVIEYVTKIHFLLRTFVTLICNSFNVPSVLAIEWYIDLMSNFP